MIEIHKLLNQMSKVIMDKLDIEFTYLLCYSEVYTNMTEFMRTLRT